MLRLHQMRYLRLARISHIPAVLCVTAELMVVFQLLLIAGCRTWCEITSLRRKTIPQVPTQPALTLLPPADITRL
jgi:hypothetical protein